MRGMSGLWPSHRMPISTAPAPTDPPPSMVALAAGHNGPCRGEWEPVPLRTAVRSATVLPGRSRPARSIGQSPSSVPRRRGAHGMKSPHPLWPSPSLPVSCLSLGCVSPFQGDSLSSRRSKSLVCPELFNRPGLKPSLSFLLIYPSRRFSLLPSHHPGFSRGQWAGVDAAGEGLDTRSDAADSRAAGSVLNPSHSPGGC